MDSKVLLRLEVESMKAQIIQSINLRHTDVQKKVEAAVEGFLSSNKLQAMVDLEVGKVMHAEIESYFKYGEGRKVINKIMIDRLNEAMKEKE